MCSGDGHLLDIAYFGHFGQQISLHDFRFLMHFPSYARSIVHVFRGTQGIWWGGLGGGGFGDVITFVGTFIHGRYIVHVFLRHASARTRMLVATPQGCRSAVAHVLSMTCQGVVPSSNLTTQVIRKYTFHSIII